VLPTIAPQLAWTTAFAVVVTVLHGQVYHWKIPLNFGAFSLVGLTLAIFLGFRNNTSYSRWWEARTLWGSVLNETRSFLRQAATLVDEPAQVPLVAARLIAFVHALKHQLRATDPTSDFARLLDDADRARLVDARFPPAVLLLMIGEWMRDHRTAGRLATPLIQALEGPLGHLTDALGGCERIASTPIPFTYMVIIHRTVSGYCFLLPFGLVDSIGVMTPLITAFIAYTFFALEALASEIEEPFGTEANDLALDAMSWTIESTLREMIGEPISMPPPVACDFNLT